MPSPNPLPKTTRKKAPAETVKRAIDPVTDAPYAELEEPDSGMSGIQSALQSRTVRWLIVLILGSIGKFFGYDVHGDDTNSLIDSVASAITILCAVQGIVYRIKATKKIKL